MPNPRIHLLLVVSLAVALPWMPGLSLALIGLLLACLHGIAGTAALAGLARGLLRLKWLLLGLALVYFWLAGPVDVAQALEEAGYRMAILLLMFAAVHTLLFRLGPYELSGLLIVVLEPLERVGLPGRRFGHRLGMLVARVAGEREQLANRRPRTPGHWLSWLPRLLADEIRRIEAGEAAKEVGEYAPVAPAPLGRRDWLHAGLGLLAIGGLLYWPCLRDTGAFGV